ncbi:MAG: D-alanyl-D-alanine carboxypeptidase/D-alanyl-D-alanine-endopeptidase [Actinomycetota bacterium]
MFLKSKSLLVSSLLVITAAFPTAAHANSCQPTKQLSSPHIAQLHLEVINANTGQSLLAINENQAERSASVMKVLTAAVALDVLGPNHQVTTNVVSDPQNPGRIYLVGAGDITLSRMPGSVTSYYAKAPKLDTLTRQIAEWSQRTGIQISEVFIDSSLYGSDNEWHPTWSKRGLSDGYMAAVSALQIDAGRLTSSRNNLVWLAKRTATPVAQAGELFIASLNARGLATGLTASVGKAPANAQSIASVQSRPMSEWVANMLRVSDNSLAEALGRLSLIKSGMEPKMENLTALYKKVLSARGINTSKLKIVDASGLSSENAVPVALVNDVLVQVNQGAGEYEFLRAGLPISGEKGSLRTRFATGNLKAARGLVAAKTGYISSGYSLAGFVTAKDGTPLIFTVYNLSPKAKLTQRNAMDNLVYRFYQCGANLTR